MYKIRTEFVVYERVDDRDSQLYGALVKVRLENHHINSFGSEAEAIIYLMDNNMSYCGYVIIKEYYLTV